MRTELGDLPVVGTLRQCINTEIGWRGVDEAGVVLEVRSWEQAQGRSTHPARIPDNNRIMKYENGRAVGVLVLKRKRKRKCKCKRKCKRSSSQNKKKPHDIRVVGL
jgi:hypothetical protein